VAREVLLEHVAHARLVVDDEDRGFSFYRRLHRGGSPWRPE
jgi:hypothetical protein